MTDPHGRANPHNLLAALLVAASASGCSGVQSMLDPAGPAAEMIADLWWWMAAGATFVLGLVMALLWRALARPGQRLATSRGVGLIIAGGIVMPTSLLIVLLVYGTDIGRKVRTLEARPRLVVEVEGRQWSWRFSYLDAAGDVVRTTVDRLVLPAGRTVEFHITSSDVIHSFWVPRLGGKIDAIPGHINLLRLRADHAGPMRGQCAEFCGLRHAHMAFDVDVVAADEFDRWLAVGADASQAHTPGPHAVALSAPGKWP